MDLTPGPGQDQERSDEPMYVILERQPLEAEKFRRKVLFVRPLSRADAEDLADNQRDIAKYCGRHDDTYEVYELCKPGALEAAHRSGREDAAKEVPERVAVAAERLRRDIREAIDVCYGELGGEADTPEDVAGVERAIAHDMARVLDWITAAARGTANTERGSEG